MEPIVDCPEVWVRGDVVRDVRSGKKGKIFKLGDGETVYHRDQSGNVVFDNYGEGWLLLQFSEPATKVKQGRKWNVVPGKREEMWIELSNRDFVNLSDAVRKNATNDIGDRSVGASSATASSVADQSTAASSVEDQNATASSIAVDSSLNFDHDENNFNDWIAEDIEDDGSVDTTNNTSLEAVSSSSLQSEAGLKRAAPVQVSTLTLLVMRGYCVVVAERHIINLF